MKITKNIFILAMHAASLLNLFPIVGMHKKKPRIPRLELPEKEYLEEYRQEIIHLDLPFEKYRHVICNSPYYSERYGHWAAGWPNYPMCEDDNVKRARMLAMIESRVKNKQDLHIPITPVDDRFYYPAIRTIMNDAVEDDKFIAVTRKLLGAGVNPNAICSSDGWHPLQLALLNGAKETSRLLLKVSGINIHIKSPTQQSLLHYARIGFESIEDQYDVIELFLKAGLNPNSVNGVGQTELFDFALEGKEAQQIILLMGKYGLKVNSKDNESETALDRVNRLRELYRKQDQAMERLYIAADIIEQVPKIQARSMKRDSKTYLSLLPFDVLYDVFNRYHE